MMHKRLVISLVMSMMLMLMNIGGFSAQTAQAKEVGESGLPDAYTYQLATNGTDSVFSGLYDDDDYSFMVMPYWQVTDIAIQLDYKVSQIASARDSEVTLLINNHPFFSFHPKVSSENSIYVQTISASIPFRYIHSGANTVRISTSVNEDNGDKICRTDNSNDWLTIYKTSLVRVLYQNQSYRNTIHNFLERFSGIDTQFSGENKLVISNKAANAELRAAAYSLTGLNQIRGNYPDNANRRIQIEKWRDRSKRDNQWLIFFSLYQNLPKEIQKKINAASVAQSALIQSMQLGKQHILVVTSAQQSLLSRAGQLMANQSITRQLATDKMTVTRNTPVKIIGQSLQNRQKLMTNDVTLVGPFHQERNYYMTLPSNAVLAGGSKVQLFFKYSKNLNFNRSLVTVSVNGTPIGSKRLKEENADSDQLTLFIPTNENIHGNFTVTIGYDLDMDGLKCMPIGSKTPWAVISHQSYVQLYTEDQKNLLFQNFPFPFIENEQLNKLAIVLPKERDSAVLQTLANTLALISDYSKTNSGQITFYDSNTFRSQEHKDDNVIAIGSYKNNAFIHQLNTKLFIKYNKNGTGFQSNEKHIITSFYGHQLGTLQLLRSPMQSDRAVLVITAPNSSDMTRVSKDLSSPSRLNSIYGDGVFSDQDNLTQSNRYKKRVALTSNSFDWLTPIKEKRNLLPVLLVIGVLLITLILTIVLLVIKYRKRGKEDEE